MTDLFRRQSENAALSKAEAQRRAMMAMAETGTFKDAAGKNVFSYAHPIFWAPFSIIGDSGNRPTS